MKYNYLGGARQMEKKSGYTAGPFTVDEVGFIQIAPAKVLAAVARGEIDLNRIAREELASRGLGLHGEWVGFEMARKLHGVDLKGGTTMTDELKCDRCGRTEDVDLYTVDGVCDENGNSIGVPLCEGCAETEN